MTKNPTWIKKTCQAKAHKPEGGQSQEKFRCIKIEKIKRKKEKENTNKKIKANCRV